MFTFLILEIVSWLAACAAFLIFIVHLARHKAVRAVLKQRGIYIPLALACIAASAGMLSNKTYAPDFAMPMFMHSEAPGGVAPTLPIVNILQFM
jgi:hypothetical protein